MSSNKDSSKAERIRQELWKTFVYEIDELLENLEQQLLELDSDYANKELVAGLFRTMHTVKGTCGMMGLTKVESFTHKAEDLLDSVRDGKAEMSGSIMDLLFNVADILKGSSQDIIEHKNDDSFEAPGELVNQLEAVLNEIHQISPLLDSKLSDQGSQKKHQPSGVNAELLSQLKSETLETVDNVERTCLELEITPHDKKLIDDLFRHIHSLKGNVNLAGMVNATQFLHIAEDMIGAARDGTREGKSTLTKEHLDILFRITDVLSQHFKGMKKSIIDLEKGLTSEIINAIQTLEQPKSENTMIKADTEKSESPDLQMLEGDGQIQLDVDYVDTYIDFFEEQVKHIAEQLSQTPPQFDQINNILDDLIHASTTLQAQKIIHFLTRACDFIESGEAGVVDIIDLLNSTLEGLLVCRGNLEGFKAFAIGEGVNNNPVTQSTLADNENVIPDAFFDQLWTLLSSARKALDKLPSLESPDKELHVKLNQLKAHCQNVEELAVDDLFSDIYTSLDSNASADEKLDQSSKALQTIYTICWDLEDAVSEGGLKLHYRTSPASLNANESVKPDSYNTSNLESSLTNASSSESSDKSEDLDISVDRDIFNVIETDINDSVALNSEVDPLFILDFIAESRNRLMAFEQQIVELQELQVQGKTVQPDLLIDLLKDIGDAALGVDVVSVYELCIDQLQSLSASDWVFQPEVLKLFVVSLYRELVQAQDSIPDSVQRRHHSDLNLSHVFKQWHAEQCLVSAPWLVRVISELFENLNAATDKKKTQESIHAKFVQLLPELAQKIESFLFAAQFYKLGVTEKALLAFRDFIIRAGFNQELVTQELLNTLIQIVKTTAHVLTHVATEGEVSEYELIGLTEKLSDHSDVNVNDHLIISARRFLHAGELPECLENVIDDHTLMDVAIALQQERNIFLLYVDVDHDDEMADKTFDLMNSKNLKTLMSATEFVQDKSIFQCLIVTDSGEAELTQQLKTIDATQTFLYLKSLALPDHIGLKDSFVSHVQPVEFQQEHLLHLNETIAELIAAKSTIDQIVLGLGEDDLYEKINSLVVLHKGWDSARFAVQKVLRQADDERKSLLQAQDQFSELLSEVQYGLRQLQEVHVVDICKEAITQIELGSALPAKLDFRCDNEYLLIEHQHKQVIQETLVGLFSQLSKVASDLKIDTITGQLFVIERLDEVIFQIRWSKQIMEQFVSNDEVWLKFSEALEQLMSNKCTDEQREYSIAHERRNQFELIISRHVDVIDAIVVRLFSDYYVIPTHLVQRIINASEVTSVKGSAMGEESMIKVGSQLYPVTEIVSGQSRKMQTSDESYQKIVLLLQHGQKVCSLLVDELVGMQQVVLSPLHGELQSNEKIQSCVVLGRDRIGFVLKSSAVFNMCS